MTVRLLGNLLVLMAIALLPVAGTHAQAPSRVEARGVEVPPAVLPPSAGHGWMTIRDDRDQSTILLHLPPRTAGGDERGAVRIAPGVTGQTEAVASFGDRVWLALTPERGRGQTDTTLRRMVTLTAVRGVGGAWTYPPGRPEILPPLAGRDEIVGFVGTDRGPIVLTRSRIDHSGARSDRAWSLQLLVGASWQSLPLPWREDNPPGSGASVRMVATAGDLQVLVFPAAPGPLTIHRATLLDPPPHGSTDTSRLEWMAESWSLEGLARDGESGFAPDSVHAVGDGPSHQLVAATWLDGAVELVVLRPSKAVLLTTVEGVPREHRIAALSSTDSLAILWWEVSAQSVAREPVPGSTAGRKFTIAEVSAISGKLLYRGENKGGGIMSGAEFKFLGIALLLVTALVLLFALRAEPTANLTLPDGFAVADPLRRIIAAAVDLVPGVVIASFALGIEPETMVSPAILLGPAAELLAWPFALGLTIIHCTLGEALAGRSIGKAITGCEVASLALATGETKVQLGPIRVWQALVRNLVRWGVPVLGIMLLIDGSRRHPADAAARTIVVVRVEEPEDE